MRLVRDAKRPKVLQLLSDNSCNKANFSLSCSRSFSGGLVSGRQSLHHGEQPFGARQLRARGISKLRPSVGLRMCEGANSETGKDEERVSRVDAALSAAVNKTQESFNKSVEKGEAKEAVRMMRSTEGLTVTLEQVCPRPPSRIGMIQRPKWR